jgi:hypothetical protein
LRRLNAFELHGASSSLSITVGGVVTLTGLYRGQMPFRLPTTTGFWRLLGDDYTQHVLHLIELTVTEKVRPEN